MDGWRRSLSGGDTKLEKCRKRMCQVFKQSRGRIHQVEGKDSNGKGPKAGQGKVSLGIGEEARVAGAQGTRVRVGQSQADGWGPIPQRLMAYGQSLVLNLMGTWGGIQKKGHDLMWFLHDRSGSCIGPGFYGPGRRAWGPVGVLFCAVLPGKQNQ